MWRKEPYRVLFPLGAALAWAGVLHWLLLAAFGWGSYQSISHSIVQIQGFMMCFAVGFLFTAIPRRTGTAPPAAWQMAVGVTAPIGTTVAAWTDHIAVSQAFWGVLVLTLIGFAVARFTSGEAKRRPPNSFVWVPLALLMGIGGSVLMGLYGALRETHPWLHPLGKGLLLEGMFLGFVMGVGGMVLPLITCGDAPPDAVATRRDHLIRAAHLGAAALLIASFALEAFASARAGLALRAAVVLTVLVVGARIWRFPRKAGGHRRLVWLSAWLIPAGYLLAAALPGSKQAGMHVVFVGGFALMAFSVGLHVTLAHGGHEELVHQTPWQVPVFGALFLLALVLRGLLTLDPARLWWWMGGAASAFLLATVFWGSLALPKMRGGAAAEHGDSA